MQRGRNSSPTLYGVQQAHPLPPRGSCSLRAVSCRWLSSTWRQETAGLKAGAHQVSRAAHNRHVTCPCIGLDVLSGIRWPLSSCPSFTLQPSDWSIWPAEQLHPEPLQQHLSWANLHRTIHLCSCICIVVGHIGWPGSPTARNC